MRLVLKQEITVGNILTSVSVLVSIGALLVSWSQDRALARHEQANEVRSAAAKTMAKFERWREISLFVFDEIQPFLVETSGMLALNRGHDSVINARDYLYKRIQESHLETQKRLVDEEIETAYVYLYSYHPTMRDRFESTLATLKQLEVETYNGLLAETQDEVLRYLDQNVAKETYETAMLGNALRMATRSVRERFWEKIDDALIPMQKFLSSIVLKSDKALLGDKQWIGKEGTTGES